MSVSIWQLGIVQRVSLDTGLITVIRRGTKEVNPPEAVTINNIRFNDVFTMYARCKKAALCFYWCWRTVSRLNKDIGLLIAEKYIWASRDLRAWDFYNR
jgi:hypothetical protein